MRVYPGILIWQLQDDKTLSQDNPDSGVPYLVMDTTPNVRVIGVAAICTWTAQPSPLELHLTIDGQPITHKVTDPADGMFYRGVIDEGRSPTTQLLVNTVPEQAFLYECRSVKVEAEITGGTVSNLTARVKWATL